MDMVWYHAAGWLLAVGMTAYGIGRRPDRRTLPLFLIAGMVIAVGAGLHGGLGIIGEHHATRYMTGFSITAVGLAIWSIAYVSTNDDA